MPGLAILAATSEVCECEDAALVSPDEVRDLETRGERNVEPAIAVEEGGRGAIEFRVFTMNEEEGNSGAVLAFEEFLAGDEVIGVEEKLRLPEKRCFPRLRDRNGKCGQGWCSSRDYKTCLSPSVFRRIRRRSPILS